MYAFSRRVDPNHDRRCEGNCAVCVGCIFKLFQNLVYLQVGAAETVCILASHDIGKFGYGAWVALPAIVFHELAGAVSGPFMAGLLGIWDRR